MVRGIISELASVAPERSFSKRLLMWLSTAAASVVTPRVLVTPVGVVAPTKPAVQPIPEDTRPCYPSFNDDDELEPCGCYGSLPAKCTRLLHRDEPSDKIVCPDTCGAFVGSTPIPPDSCEGGYYGFDSSLSPESVLENGLPSRGTNWDLINHAEQRGNSAFRGTTKLVTYPGGGGAAAWADAGGYVYEITCVPSWDVNKHTEGRRLVSDFAVGRQRFGGNLVMGEHEHAIPSRVPPEHIKRYGAVVESASGVPFVPRNSWVDNPKWEASFCRYSLSDCEGEVPDH